MSDSLITGQSAIGNRKSAMYQWLCKAGNAIASITGQELGWPIADAPNAKSAFAAPLAGTVTSIFCSVPFAPPSCQATTVYLPAGTPLIVKLPSSAVTAKNGCFDTATYDFIH